MRKLKAIGFWIASFTWGLPITVIGGIVALCLLVTRHKPQMFHHYVYFVVGKNWGGFGCGCFIVVSENGTEAMLRHEGGHGIQNIMLGIFMPFLVSIPSAIRYWYREYLIRCRKRSPATLPAYNSIWFERWATELGDKFLSRAS